MSQVANNAGHALVFSECLCTALACGGSFSLLLRREHEVVRGGVRCDCPPKDVMACSLCKEALARSCASRSMTTMPARLRWSCRIDARMVGQDTPRQDLSRRERTTVQPRHDRLVRYRDRRWRAGASSRVTLRSCARLPGNGFSSPPRRRHARRPRCSSAHP